MRALALVLAACLLGLALPAFAEAHEAECHVENVRCVTNCERDHLTTAGPHACYYYGRTLA